MWQLIRPDAIDVLDSPLVKRVLPRYVKVVRDKLPAKFQIAKRIAFDLDRSMSTEELWERHLQLMEEFYKLLNLIDRGKVSIKNLKIPLFSLIDLKMILTKDIMKSCGLCERKCGVNRIESGKGFCRVGNTCRISSEFIHLGEEPWISPSHTIFFMGCTMKCQFCQNWTISQWYESGSSVVPNFLARRIEERREGGAKNVNLVGGSPTPNLLWILETLKLCNANAPVVWNSNFYMSERTMKILDGVVDMHLSDFKYGNNECGLRLSKTPNYFDVCSRNHLTASKTTEITLRHLILPNHIDCCTKPVLEWMAKNIKKKCVVNLMDQYRPEYKAREYPEINRGITIEEFEEAVKIAKKLKINFVS